MDETAIYLDCPTNYTYTNIGVKRVKASTAGGERTRVSAAFTAAANGHKLPVFAIIPRVIPLPELDAIQNLQFKYRTKATFDEAVNLGIVPGALPKLILKIHYFGNGARNQR